jgi:hypothetical protein
MPDNSMAEIAVDKIVTKDNNHKSNYFFYLSVLPKRFYKEIAC